MDDISENKVYRKCTKMRNVIELLPPGLLMQFLQEDIFSMHEVFNPTLVLAFLHYILVFHFGSSILPFPAITV